jgi:putative oxidoreductase
MDILYLIGRIVLAVFFLFSAIGHFTRVQMMSGYARSKGVPLAPVAVVATGVQLAAGGVMLLLGWYVWVGSLILIAFLVPVALIMHNFWAVKDPQMRMVEMVQFLKNLAIAAALLVVLAYSRATGWNPIGLAP